jgi:hypothetical protein
MGDHINADGQFQSDKYPWCRPGFVPLKITDAGAWQPLWDYAEQRRAIDVGFADDLQAALRAAGYVPPALDKVVLARGSVADPGRDKCFRGIQLVCAGLPTATVLAAQIDSLGCTIAFAADDPDEAHRIIAHVGGDLAKAVDNNWQAIKDQTATVHGKPGNG